MKRIPLLSVLILLTVSVLFIAACGEQSEREPASPDTQAANIGESAAANEQAGQETHESASGEPQADSESDDADSNKSDDPEMAVDFSFKMSDHLIIMDQDINEVLAAAGEPIGVFEAPSCAFDGVDRVFGYPGLQIHTYPVGDSDHIHTISFRDDSVVTTEGGIRLGDSLQKMLDAYGTDYRHDTGMYTFTRGRTTLEFFVQDDIIMGITYGFIIE